MPVLELRAAIPFALFKLHRSLLFAFSWSVFGTLLPVPFLVAGLVVIERICIRSHLGTKIFTWWIGRIRRRVATLHHSWGIDVALAIFVAIPLPGTGAWTGAGIAWVLGMRPLRAIISIGIGTLGAAVIVSAISLGVITFFH